MPSEPPNVGFETGNKVVWVARRLKNWHEARRCIGPVVASVPSRRGGRKVGAEPDRLPDGGSKRRLLDDTFR